MQELAMLFRFKQLLVHNMHNECSRLSFFQDHEMFGSLYEKAESNYDDLIERMIGLSIPLELRSIQIQAAQKLASAPEPKFSTAMFELVLSVNKDLLSKLEALCKAEVSCGTQNMLAGVADQLEMENYKLLQRVRK